MQKFETKEAYEAAINFIKWAIENHSVPYEGFSFPVWINGEEYDAEKLFDVYVQSKRMVV